MLSTSHNPALRAIREMLSTLWAEAGSGPLGFLIAGQSHERALGLFLKLLFWDFDKGLITARGSQRLSIYLSVKRNCAIDLIHMTVFQAGR